MATSLETLITKLYSTPAYQRMSAQEIEAEAQRRYQAAYDQKRLSAQRAYESSDAALAREIAGLAQSYNQQRARSAADTRQTYAQADRQALSRGMQRSSYNNASLANIALSGQSALRSIDAAQAARQGDLSAQRSLLSQQLASQLAQYDASQKADERAYADELEAREYERWLDSSKTYSEMAMQLYEYQRELEEAALEQARWQAEFNAKYAAPAVQETRSSSSGGSTKKKEEPEEEQEPPTSTHTTINTTVRKSSAKGSGSTANAGKNRVVMLM